MAAGAPVLTIVVPCFNEESVLAHTAEQLSELVERLWEDGFVAQASSIVFVDDGSKDRTWEMVQDFASRSPRFGGIKLSRNRGHQNALLAGLLTARGDVLISIDADLQDDLQAIEKMLIKHREGCEIVYGIRLSRDTDTAMKRHSAELYYRLLNFLGAEVIFNHADYRLMSRRAIDALKEFGEVNFFLRGIIPLLSFETATVGYARSARFAGETKYPLRKMLALAIEGVTSLTTTPIRWITVAGLFVSALSLSIGVWALVASMTGSTLVPGWASTIISFSILGGIQLLSIGIIGEYVGKIYVETKRRPRYIIEREIESSSASRRPARPVAVGHEPDYRNVAVSRMSPLTPD
jgi:glycosyltransferase involved in cell wall biosynthesis